MREGGLVAFPTETVYGLGADATSAAAVAKIYDAKDRPSFNPLIAHVADLDAARREAELPAGGAATRRGLLAGTADAGRAARAGRLGLRSRPRRPRQRRACGFPRAPVAHALIAAAGRPIAAPSANRSGHVSPVTARACRWRISAGASIYVLDGGRADRGLESTIVSLLGERAAAAAARRDDAGGDRGGSGRAARCGAEGGAADDRSRRA